MAFQRSATMFFFSNQSWVTIVTGFTIISACVVTAAVTPTSNCYGLGADNQLYDLTNLYGREYEKEVDKKTYSLRFCKDFQQRSQELVGLLTQGYISFGSYESGAKFISESKETSFIQKYTHGDLSGCERHGTEFNGRDAEVSVICGSSCPNTGACKDSSGCICSVTFDNPCVASVVLAIPCLESGPRVISGFTIGFSPRGKEVVADGLTQWGFESDQHMDYSFETLQSQVFLYFSAPIQVATEIGKPIFALSPSKGLEVQLSGTAASGVAPTTLAPTLLEINWRCETTDIFLVKISVPVKGYDSVVFSLLKICDTTQTKQANGSSGWATFGVLSCIFFLMTTMCCCAGFLYGTRVENKHGLQALPGIDVLSTCLDAASKDTGGYRRAAEGSTTIGDHPLRAGSSANPRGGQRSLDGSYGSV